mmetsp:Transcript_71881/g.138892  ORF Transcript_71881/g.138892 Transcript_71881/m.138892 type:complete len:100 (-) Transcript_71881:164-463(-)
MHVLGHFGNRATQNRLCACTALADGARRLGHQLAGTWTILVHRIAILGRRSFGGTARTYCENGRVHHGRSWGQISAGYRSFWAHRFYREARACYCLALT